MCTEKQQPGDTAAVFPQTTLTRETFSTEQLQHPCQSPVFHRIHFGERLPNFIDEKNQYILPQKTQGLVYFVENQNRHTSKDVKE